MKEPQKPYSNSEGPPIFGVFIAVLSGLLFQEPWVPGLKKGTVVESQMQLCLK